MIDKYVCCNSPKHQRAWIMKIFKCKYCLNCEEVIGDDNPVMEWLFKWVFLAFWDGSVAVPYDEE